MNTLHDQKEFIEYKAYHMRLSSLMMTTAAGSGHVTSCLSAADIVATLFFYGMRFDPHNIDNIHNDRFILSKGHAAPILYAAWKEIGLLTHHDLMMYRAFDSVLEGHPTRRCKYVEAATGALGIGLSIGVGMALNAKMDQLDYRTYVLLGDAELAEGSVWEAAEIASRYTLDNLIGIVDCNRLGQSSESVHGHHIQRYADMFQAFGWHTFVVDGHNVQQLMGAIDKAREYSGQSVMILAKTFKGHGVALFENKEGFHGKALTKEELSIAIEQLEASAHQAATYHGNYQWQPYEIAQSKQEQNDFEIPALDDPKYARDDTIAPRKAYGQALTALGKVCPQVISLDADVKNSTYAELFEEKFPDRFVQCFVAEQNMVSMAVGFERRGKLPFVSTFAAFFSRAHDQIRMASIGEASLRLVGSHAGVSIGQDGPSQMGLEDIALMNALPNSIVLYPADGVSTYKLVEVMARYTDGISYLRTTRAELPILYENYEDFVVGGCKVVRQSENDVICIVAAGITVHEAIKAYDVLQKQNISVAVIDVYSVKPLDVQTITLVATRSANSVITVEDHYLQGGIGQAVSYALRNTGIHVESLAVTELPRSGKMEELLAWAGIDAQAIVNKVKKS